MADTSICSQDPVRVQIVYILWGRENNSFVTKMLYRNLRTVCRENNSFVTKMLYRNLRTVCHENNSFVTKMLYRNLRTVCRENKSFVTRMLSFISFHAAEWNSVVLKL